MDKICPDLTKNAAPLALALVLTGGFFGFIYMLFISNEIPKDNSAQLNILLGGIAAVWAKAISFFYDSSASSKAKDETISEIAKTPVAPIAPIAPVAPVAPVAPIAPVIIPNAEAVTVKTESGDVTVTKKDEL